MYIPNVWVQIRPIGMDLLVLTTRMSKFCSFVLWYFILIICDPDSHFKSFWKQAGNPFSMSEKS